MADCRLEELRSENQRLRDLLILVSTTLLRNVALDPPKHRRNFSTGDAEQLFQEAEKCFRCATIDGQKSDIAKALEVAGNELMARAVEIETVLQREKWTK